MPLKFGWFCWSSLRGSSRATHRAYSSTPCGTLDDVRILPFDFLTTPRTRSPANGVRPDSDSLPGGRFHRLSRCSRKRKPRPESSSSSTSSPGNQVAMTFALASELEDSPGKAPRNLNLRRGGRCRPHRRPLLRNLGASRRKNIEMAWYRYILSRICCST